MTSEGGLPLKDFYDDNWTWNEGDKSQQVELVGEDLKTVKFHCRRYYGTAGVRGTRVLNGGRYYWEITFTGRMDTKNMLIGIATKEASLETDHCVELLGRDRHGWGLSHHGYLWHANYRMRFSGIPYDKPTTIGILFDGIIGTLTYYKDGKRLGVAFRNLHLVNENLYPAVCSTAIDTVMSLGIAKREINSLQHRCRTVILKSLKMENHIEKLPVPKRIKKYLSQDTYTAKMIRFLDE